MDKMKFLLPVWALAVGVLSSCGRTHGSTAAEFSAVPVTVLERTSVEVPHTYIADVKAVQFVEVRPMVEGYVREILVDEGQRVRRGQPLFRIGADRYGNALRQAEANLRQAEAQLRMAEYETERVGRMVAKEIMAPIRLEQAEAQREAARTLVEQAGAQLQQARTDYGYTTVTSPFDGYVDRIRHKVGSLVTPEDLLTTVSDVSDVFAYYRMNEADYLRRRRSQLEGEPVPESGRIELLLPDGSVYPYPGRAETTESEVERTTGSIAFRVRFPNPEGLLRHGATGHVRVRRTLDSVVLVPQKSTFEIQEFTYVYAVGPDGKAHTRSFTPLDRYGKYYITDDIAPGTTIVYEGMQGVREGMRIAADTVSAERVVAEASLPDTLTK